MLILYFKNQMENDGDKFAPGGAGFCLAWPPAAKVANRATARATLENFTKAIPLISGANNGTNNGWENDNGQIAKWSAISQQKIMIAQGQFSILSAFSVERLKGDRF